MAITRCDKVHNHMTGGRLLLRIMVDPAILDRDTAVNQIGNIIWSFNVIFLVQCEQSQLYFGGLWYFISELIFLWGAGGLTCVTSTVSYRRVLFQSATLYDSSMWRSATYWRWVPYLRMQEPDGPPHGHHGDSFIYVYDLPSKFNKDGEQLETTWHSTQYDYDVFIHKYLAASPFRTLDPHKAHLFYLPLYLGRRFSHGWTWPTFQTASHEVRPLHNKQLRRKNHR